MLTISGGHLEIRGNNLEELIEALGRLGDERSLEALIALMDARNPEVRRVVIDALSTANWPSPGEPEPTDSPGPTSPSTSTSPDHAGPADPPEVEPQPPAPGG